MIVHHNFVYCLAVYYMLGEKYRLDWTSLNQIIFHIYLQYITLKFNKGQLNEVHCQIFNIVSPTHLDINILIAQFHISHILSLRYISPRYIKLEDLGATRPSFQLLRRAGGPLGSLGPCGPCWGPSAPSMVAISKL